MHSLIKKVNNQAFFISLQALLSVLFIFPYFFQKQALYGEAQFFSSWQLWLEKTGSTWLSLGMGAPTAQGIGNNFPVLYVWAFLEKMGISFHFIQFFWYFLLFFLPFLFFFLLANRIFKLNYFYSFLVASFYIYNPVFFNYWLNLNPWLMPIYYMLPLFWFIIGTHWQNNVKTFGYVALAFFLSLYIFANPPYLVVFLLSIGLALLFFSLFFHEKILFKALIKKGMVVYGALFLVANFIITSIILNYRYSIATYEGAVDPIEILESNSEWSRLGSIFLFKQLFFDETSFSFLHYLMNFPLLYLIFIIPVVLIFILPLAQRREKAVYLILGVLLGMLFLIKGLNEPFSAAFLYFFEHIPLFNMFKTAPEKFSPLYVYCISLCVVFLLRIDSRRVTRITRRLVVVWIGVLALPLYSFQLIPTINHLGVNITHFFHEPYLEDVTTFLNSEKHVNTIMSLPGSRSYLVHLRPTQEEKYYLGLDPIINNTRAHAIEAFYHSPLTDAVYESLLKERYHKIFSMLGVSHIVLNMNTLPGFGFYKDVNAEQYEEMLRDEYPVVYTAGPVKVYENTTALPKFYMAENIVATKNKKEDLLEVLSDPNVSVQTAVIVEEQNKKRYPRFSAYNGKKLDTGKSSLEFKKVSVTKYRVNILRASQVVPLVFGENFHEYWNVYRLPFLGEVQTSPRAFVSTEVGGSVQNDNLSSGKIWDTWFKKSLGGENVQGTVNGYGNIWLLDIGEVCHASAECQKNEDGTYNISLIVEYWPQRVFYAGVAFSMLVVCISLFCIYRKKKKYIHEHDKGIES